MSKLAQRRLVVAAISLDSVAGREALRGVTSAAERLGWSLETVDFDFIRKDWTPYRSLLARADGAIVRPGDALADGTLAALGIPIVAIDHLDPDWSPAIPRRSPGKGPWASVCIDTEALVAAAADELLATGRKCFAFVPMPRANPWSKVRGRLFKARIRDAGCIARLYEPVTEWNWAEERESLSRWFARLPRPFGVFAANDMLAKFALDACRAAGLDVPRDAAIVGADDDPTFCLTARPNLSSVRIDFEESGRLAAGTLDSLFGRPQPKRILFPRYGVLGVSRRASTRVDPAPEQRADPRLGDGLAFVESRSSDPLIGVGDVARAIGVGRRQAERIFAANGKSIRLCIEESRLVRARELLAGSDKTAAAIAVECGFASETYFSRLFRRRHSMSPGTWRRNETFRPVRRGDPPQAPR